MFKKFNYTIVITTAQNCAFALIFGAYM